MDQREKQSMFKRSHGDLKFQAELSFSETIVPYNRLVRRNSVLFSDQGDAQLVEGLPGNSLGKAFSELISYTAAAKNLAQSEPVTNSLTSLSSAAVDNSNGRSSAAETFRVSFSSIVSSSSHGSGHEDFDVLGNVLIWGEGIGDGVLGGGVHRCGGSSSTKMDALLPKALVSTVVLDIHNVACGGRHAVLVTKQGEIFSGGEGEGGRLGHGVEEDVSHPKLIDALSRMNIVLVACGENHTCAVTFSGDLYTWGDGSHNSGLLGHGSNVSHWIPKKLSVFMEGIQVSFISCGPWHTALVTSAGQLFTFGDGTFGALGHGDRGCTCIPTEVESLKGLRTLRVACGVWHTAAVVEVETETSSSEPFESSSSGMLFTWGDGDKGRLGHGDKEPRLVPELVAALVDVSFFYTMGSTDYGQLGNPLADGKIPTCVEGKIADSFVEEIACGSYHVAVLTSKTEVYTWVKGANGQLGHGDSDNRNTPTLVDFFKDKQVKRVVCGVNFTAVICLYRLGSNADTSVCSGCRNPFNFRRKRHNCYNCGLAFCKACSIRKALRASLAPSMNKPYRVCDDCFIKLKNIAESGSVTRMPKTKSESSISKANEMSEEDIWGSRLQGQFIRLSSFDSVNQAEGRNSNDTHVFPLVAGNTQWGIIFPSKSSNALVEASKNVFSAYVPSFRMASQATSPVSTTPTSSRSLYTSEVILGDSKHKNDSPSQEVINLRAQVEDLTRKSQLLEAEVERSARELKEATASAANEAEKCKAAKDVIKSLTAQLKEMAERVPEGHIAGKKLNPIVRRALGDLIPTSKEGNMMSIISPRSESNINSSNPFLFNGTKTLNEKSEWVVQDEPGVRKCFNEEQAEKWWAENEVRVCKQHNIRTA
ncbi:PH, RCC1 and FYVE domains-containing protein 1 [Camellia lanceoleosa]|uniref:PH, RCC1 and FYVE domains-containing protein 1 n=1 Tax=Camellia lanceoleosa TaxID=1840588 RepID=A0ACC0I7D2_9ERIC|nr:PH, RCC1 and FYVE domains-containing protein 1 [Camellia lanceoleosa]